MQIPSWPGGGRDGTGVPAYLSAFFNSIVQYKDVESQKRHKKYTSKNLSPSLNIKLLKSQEDSDELFIG